MDKVKITLKKSLIGCKQDQIATAYAPVLERSVTRRSSPTISLQTAKSEKFPTS